MTTLETIRVLEEGAERFRGEVERTSDMSTWPGAGIPPEQLTTAQRRGRFYALKCATQTLALLRRHEELLAEALRPPDWRSALPVEPASQESEEEIDRQMERAEAEAERRLAELRSRSDSGSFTHPERHLR